MSKPKAHVSDKKKEIVKNIQAFMKEYPIIGIVDLENLPSLQLQRMRAQLRGKAEVKMAKGRLLRVIFKDSKIKGIEQLEEHIRGMPALIFTKESPFKLFKILQKSKASAPAKAGNIAPKDIIVPAGPTPFAPGPVIGELGALGIKSGVEDGKIAIKEDKLLVKEGEEITSPQADILTRLGIEPMEVGLNLTAILEDGTIFTRKILDVDEDAYINDLKAMSQEAMNLAVRIGYATPETITILLRKAVADAKALADSQDIITDENVGKLLAKGEAQANALNAKLGGK